jgi:CheY-like chemotaxis protein
MTKALVENGTIPKLLIADDDPSVVKFLADRCTKMGFEVQTATTGLQALVMARRSAPDVMIADVNMPELDGLSLSVHLLDSRGKPLEVIVITGKSSEETIERCDSFGATYVHKGPRLWNAVQSALGELFPDLPRVEEARGSLFRTETSARPRILVVDDDPDVLAFLTSRLRKCGVEPLVAPDGVRAFRAALREKPTLILSDCFMKEGDVNYLLWRLRSTPATERIPLFVMSGRPFDEATEEALKRDVCGKRGALRVFKKPLDIDELFLALKEHCALEYSAAQ